MKNPLGQVARICYNAYNAPVALTDANGIVTEYTYNDAGCVTRIVRRDGSDVLSSLDVAYDAAGRMIKEGEKTYTYGYLDKVMSVRDGANTYTYAYHPDGQLARANYGRARSPSAPQGEDSPSVESFAWDGLALIRRGDEQFVNEPHVGGGNPVASSKGTTYFNDILGTTVGAKSGNQYSAAVLSAFGEDLNHHSPTPTSNSHSFYTGKPQVAGLGHVFLMRNYRTSRVTRNRKGEIVSKETRGYDRSPWMCQAYLWNCVRNSSLLKSVVPVPQVCQAHLWKSLRSLNLRLFRN